MNIVYAETPQNANPNQFPRFKDSKFVLRKLKAAFTVSKVACDEGTREIEKLSAFLVANFSCGIYYSLARAKKNAKTLNSHFLQR